MKSIGFGKSMLGFDKSMFGIGNTKTKDLNQDFTDDYGLSINMISFICAVYCRLAYMNDRQFLGHYTKIFGPVIPDLMMQSINEQVIKNDTSGLLNDRVMFGLTLGKDKFDLKTFQSKEQFGGVGLQFLHWAQKINIINGEQRIDANTANCDFDVKQTIANDKLVFVSIETSNYGEIFVVGDKRMPNIVTVIFRGTSDAKSAGSYTKLSSLKAMWTGNVAGLKNKKEKYLYGIYKILMDTIHILMHSINYVKDKIKNNEDRVSVISTGHSLGGALATIFAYVYVSHVSNSGDFNTLYPRLNINIACFSLGSPKVFDKELANIFCSLTTNNSQSKNRYNGEGANVIKGRITYLRIVSHNDPIPMLPLKQFGFLHPCSSETGLDTDELTQRKNTNVNCLVQIDNEFSDRCRGTRLAMTYNFKDKPLNCVDTTEERMKNAGTFHGKNPTAHHTEYLGISFVGGVSFGNVLNNNIQRVREPIGLSKKGNTVCRLIFYPSVSNNAQTASVGFYDLSIKRDVTNISDLDFEKAEETEMPVVDNNIKFDEKKPSVTPSNYTNKILSLVKNMGGLENMVRVTEDIYDSKKVFEEILKNATPYNILTDLPPIKYAALISVDKSNVDRSFEGDVVIKGGTMKRSRNRRKTMKRRKSVKRSRKRRK